MADIRDLIANVRENGDGITKRLISDVIRKQIDILRESNDTAEGNQVYRNQGGVAEFKRLLVYLNPKEK